MRIFSSNASLAACVVGFFWNAATSAFKDAYGADGPARRRPASVSIVVISRNRAASISLNSALAAYAGSFNARWDIFALSGSLLQKVFDNSSTYAGSLYLVDRALNSPSSALYLVAAIV